MYNKENILKVGVPNSVSKGTKTLQNDDNCPNSKL